MTSQIVFTFLAMWCLAFTPGGADDACEWEEKAGIALQQLQAPAVVLREYSDVTSSRDCYQKCCDLKTEGCNIAVYLSYDTEVVCMNVKCVPFENCIWGPYGAAIAALNDKASTFDSVILGGASNTSSVTTSSPSIGDGSGANQNGTTGVALTTNVPVSANDTTSATSVNNNPAGNKPTTQATNINDNNALNFDKDQSLGNNDGRVDENGLSSESNVGSDSNFQDGSAGNKSSDNPSVYIGGSERSHVNYTVSITIGVLTCVAFLLIMYVAAKRFHLFQDRSKYSRLLENPEQLNEPLMLTPEA